MSISGEFARVRNRPFLSKKPWAIAHGFENGRILVSLEIAPNSLKYSYTLANGFVTPGGLFVSISGEFARVRNRPFLSKKPGL